MGGGHFCVGIGEGVKLYIPHKIAKVKNGPSRITANITKLMRERDRLYKSSKKSDRKEIQEKYRKLKHEIQRKGQTSLLVIYKGYHNT